MQYVRVFLRHWLAISAVALFSAAASVGVSMFLLQQYYSSEVSLIIVQKQQQFSDAYATQKAAEKLGRNLIKVVETSDFMNRVVATGYISSDILSASTEERKGQWKTMVKAEMIPETGVLVVTGYGLEPQAAEDVALGVMTVLTTNAADYHGGGGNVEIKHIDGPVTSSRPVRPNIIQNGVAAFILGAAVMYLLFVIRAEAAHAKTEREGVRYETQSPSPTSPGSQPLFPVSEAQYKVLDEYPMQPYVYGAELKDASAGETSAQGDEEDAVSMHDHLEKK